MVLDVPIWLMWFIATVLAISVPAGVLTVCYLLTRGGEVGSPDVEEQLVDGYWAEYLTEEEEFTLAVTILNAQLRQHAMKDIDWIV